MNNEISPSKKFAELDLARQIILLTFIITFLYKQLFMLK